MQRWRMIFLLAASYVFYTLFDVRFAAILCILTGITYSLGRAIPTRPRPRLLLWIGVGLNLGVLGIFKYFNFFTESASAILQRLGSNATIPTLSLLLPIGISFYTFQAISYLTEIHRKKLTSDHSLVDVALYLTFFPKIIAGPLVRPGTFFDQTSKHSEFPKSDVIKTAITLVILGLFKKLLIADALASVSDTAYRAALSPESQSFPAPLYWQGFYLFAFQIYADFSGYTDIARGSSLLLGFTLPENFNRPYWAATLGDFWNRWHMSLTGWFREYLFFPISRALLTRTNPRFPRAVQIASNLITMILIGLWHGAAWTFVGWGLWHGVLLSIERILNWKPNKRWQSILSAVLTFHLVALGWVLFRATSFEMATRFIGGLFSFSQVSWVGIFMPPVLLVGILTFALDFLLSQQTAVRFRWRPVVLTAALVVILGLWLLSWSRGVDQRPFIYGKF